MSFDDLSAPRIAGILILALLILLAIRISYGSQRRRRRSVDILNSVRSTPTESESV